MFLETVHKKPSTQTQISKLQKNIMFGIIYDPKADMCCFSSLQQIV